MTLLHGLLSALCLVGLLHQSPPTRTVTVFVLDRPSNRGIAADLWLGSDTAQTNADGKATFLDVREGTHRITIIAENPQYPIINWSVSVPQYEAMIFRLAKK